MSARIDTNRSTPVENRPVLSVITPCFNSARFIGETLDSVAALPISHEHIVIDGGSNDGTVEQLESRHDSSLIWISEPDQGQTHAVNKGLRRTRGDFIGWLNADDAYVPEHVEAALKLFEDPTVDAIFGFMDIVDATGRVLKRYRPGRFSWTRYLYLGEYLPTPTIIFHRSLLKQAPQLNERFADAADYDFYLRLLRTRRVKRVKETLVRFRYHASSKTATDPVTQQSEGLEIRLGYARGAPQRWLMRAIYRAKQARNTASSSWPQIP